MKAPPIGQAGLPKQIIRERDVSNRSRKGCAQAVQASLIDKSRESAVGFRAWNDEKGTPPKHRQPREDRRWQGSVNGTMRSFHALLWKKLLSTVTEEISSPVLFRCQVSRYKRGREYFPVTCLKKKTVRINDTTATQTMYFWPGVEPYLDGREYFIMHAGGKR